MMYAVDQTIAAELGVDIISPLNPSADLGSGAFVITEGQTFYNIADPSDNSTDIGAFSTNATTNIIEDVTNFFTTGIQAIIMIMKLLTGTLIFDTLSLVGIPQVWIYMIQAPMAVLIIITIVDYIRSRI